MASSFFRTLISLFVFRCAGIENCRHHWPPGYSQENVAFFGYHQAVGICEGHPFLVADSGLQSIEAFRSNDGLALSLRYVHGELVKASTVGEPSTSSSVSTCDVSDQELHSIIIVTRAPSNQTTAIVGSPTTPDFPDIVGIVIEKGDGRCLLGDEWGLKYRFKPIYAFKLLGVWGRATGHITQLGFLVSPQQESREWACGSFMMPNYAKSLTDDVNGSLRCAGGCTGQSNFMHVSKKGIQELHAYGMSEGLLTSFRIRFFHSETYIRIGQGTGLSNVDRQCALHFQPGEVITFLRLFRHAELNFFSRIELKTSHGQSCEAGQGHREASIFFTAVDAGVPLLGLWGREGDAIDCLGALVGDVMNLTHEQTDSVAIVFADNLLWLLAAFGAVSVVLLVVFWIWWRRSKVPHVQKLVRLQRTVTKLEDLHQELDSRDHQCLAQLFSFWAAAKKRRAREVLERAAASALGGPAFWAMTVTQLSEFFQGHQENLVQYCRDHALCHAEFQHVCLKSPCPHNHGCCSFRSLVEDARSLVRLVPNMHVLVPLVVKPATQAHKGIYGLAALTNLENPKPVETFVSHCWNEPFQHFVATLGTIRLNTGVWVCSFAMPQNVDISLQLKSEPMRSPFALALLKAECVLLAVDETFEPLRRSWCCYEIYLAISKNIRVEIRAGTNNKGFYEKLAATINTIDIRHCRATNARDHAKIMAALKGSEDLVNRKIRDRMEDTVQFVKALS